jgi:hypothetical protein
MGLEEVEPLKQGKVMLKKWFGLLKVRAGYTVFLRDMAQRRNFTFAFKSCWILDFQAMRSHESLPKLHVSNFQGEILEAFRFSISALTLCPQCSTENRRKLIKKALSVYASAFV